MFLHPKHQHSRIARVLGAAATPPGDAGKRPRRDFCEVLPRRYSGKRYLLLGEEVLPYLAVALDAARPLELLAPCAAEPVAQPGVLEPDEYLPWVLPVPAEHIPHRGVDGLGLDADELSLCGRPYGYPGVRACVYADKIHVNAGVC